MDFSAILKDFGIVGVFAVLVVVVARWGMTYIDSIRQDAKNEKEQLMKFISEQQAIIKESWKNVEELSNAIKQLTEEVKGKQ